MLRGLDARVADAERALAGPGDDDVADAALQEELGGRSRPLVAGVAGHHQGRFEVGVERELGAPLPTLSREDKQRAIRLLDERGAFILRRAVEDVADAMGVSRITVYNYLNALHR